MHDSKSSALSFVVPASNENRWSDLLATLISTDPVPLHGLLDAEFDTVRREVSVPAQIPGRSGAQQYRAPARACSARPEPSCGPTLEDVDAELCKVATLIQQISPRH